MRHDTPTYISYGVYEPPHARYRAMKARFKRVFLFGVFCMTVGYVMGLVTAWWLVSTNG